MAATLTLTGAIGPGVLLTAAVYPGVLYFTVDAVDNVVDMEFDSGRHVFVSVAAATTVTATKAGSTWTLTIS